MEKAIEDFFSRDNLKLTDVTSTLKTIRQNFSSIKTLLKKYEYDIVVEDCDICNEIDSSLRDIKDYFTETEEDGDTQVNNDEIHIGTNNRQNIEESKNAIDNKLYDLVVVINKKRDL